MSYRLAPRAIDDIAAIADYLHERNPTAAAEFVSGLIRRFEMLARHPYSGVGRDDILVNVRHLVLGSHIAFYRVEDGNPVILRVLNGRQNIQGQDVS